jgi:hypothetical protein
VGERQEQPFQLSFNGRLRVEFQGARVTSDGGLLPVRKLDERLGFGELIERHLTDGRGKNAQLPLADLVRQSVYSRLAGYEDVNDAERLSQDPAFRLIGSKKILERGAALTSRLRTFETGVLTQEGNFAGLATLNRELIGKAEAIDPRRRAVLDMDSTEIPVYGEQKQSAYSGHFESTCYHPLLLFNGGGDCLAARLRPGNVHNAAGWEELLLPEIERRRRRGKEVSSVATPPSPSPSCTRRRKNARSSTSFAYPPTTTWSATSGSCFGGRRAGRATDRWYAIRAFSIRRQAGSARGGWWRRSNSTSASCSRALGSS